MDQQLPAALITDIECYNDVKSWEHDEILKHGFGMGAIYDTTTGLTTIYQHDEVPAYLDALRKGIQEGKEIVTHNGKNYDYVIIESYDPQIAEQLQNYQHTVDMLQIIKRGLEKMGKPWRPGLDGLIKGTLNKDPSYKILSKEIPSLIRKGELDTVKKYLQEDIDNTLGIWQYYKQHKKVIYGTEKYEPLTINCD